MNEIELYDILTLNNKDKYTVISMANKNNKNYAMLVAVDEDENPIPEKVKIVELTNNNTTIEEVNDESTLKLITLELSKKSIEGLND